MQTALYPNQITISAHPLARVPPKHTSPHAKCCPDMWRPRSSRLLSATSAANPLIHKITIQRHVGTPWGPVEPARRSVEESAGRLAGLEIGRASGGDRAPDAVR